MAQGVDLADAGLDSSCRDGRLAPGEHVGQKWGKSWGGHLRLGSRPYAF
jgi:hypothetical protein